MGELVVRFVGGVHALFGAWLFAGGVGALGNEAPGSALDWIASLAGGLLVVSMIATGLRLGLGEPMPGWRAFVMILVTLVGGLVGAVLMAVVGAEVGR